MSLKRSSNCEQNELNIAMVLTCLVTTSRYVVPTGRVKVPTGSVVPTGRVKVPAGSIVPTGKDSSVVSTGSTKVIPAGRTILVLVVLCLLRVVSEVS
ncbi:hypothetical protein Tco_0203664 [Tanacetum coccineum]